MYDIRFCVNFKIFACGPSRCGKTCFIIDIIQNLQNIAKAPPNKILYVYKVWQQKFDELQESGLVDHFVQDQKDLVKKLKTLSKRETSLSNITCR